MEHWISIYVSQDRIQAELVKTELINAGINAVILSKVDGNFPMIGSLTLNVPEEQAEAAKKIIDDLILNEET